MGERKVKGQKASLKSQIRRLHLALCILTSVAGGYYNGPGTSALPLLKIGQGPRATAMGESNIGLADDATALYWNPGGLGKIIDRQFALSHGSFFSDLNDELLHAVLPVQTGAFGFSLIYSGITGIESYNEQDQPGDTFATWNGLLTLGYGFAFIPNYSLGVALKGCYEDLYQTQGYGGAVDLGFIGQPTPFLGFGIVARNLGAMRYNSTIQPLPVEIGAGISYTQENIKLVMDGFFPFDNQFNIRAGVEFLLVKEIALRFGYRSGPIDLTTFGWSGGLTTGLGINIGSFSLDYSLSPYGKLGLAHRIGVRCKFIKTGQGTVHIRVIDAETKKPVRATVSLSGVKKFKGETDRNGKLIITGLLPGRLMLTTTTKGYFSRSDTMFVLGDREQSAIIALQPAK